MVCYGADGCVYVHVCVDIDADAESFCLLGWEGWVGSISWVEGDGDGKGDGWAICFPCFAYASTAATTLKPFTTGTGVG